jgi:hypothetical protein
VAIEQLRDRLDQVDEPDAGEEPAPRAADARYALLAGLGVQGLLGPVLSPGLGCAVAASVDLITIAASPLFHAATFALD